MGDSSLILYIPPVLFSIVALAFLLLWRLKVTPAWQWAAGFAQTAAGFVVSTFFTEPYFAAFASGMIFIGAAYCYGSGLMEHFRTAQHAGPRLAFVGCYTIALVYAVYWKASLVHQLFLTDAGFAFLLGWSICVVTGRASRAIDKALIATTWIVVLDCVVRTVFFTFFSNSSDNLSDFATSLYNLEVTVSTITICMFFPFTALGASATAAIDRHRTAAGTDELTGLLNRRGFRDAILSDFDSGTPRGALIICDIDHFKGVNDTYGHAMGDRVIRALANELERNVASCGRIARFGGEEFVAFIPHASIEDAVGIAESIRSGFAARDWRKQGLARSVTVSCGISSIDECETTLDPAVDRADSALYAAKEAGRNSVFFRRPHGVPDTISRDMGKLFAASSRVSK
ncbi:GGDEF domain-containing protein [Rhizobium sp. BK538]|uniref:GGDEF domain-containing protein n=1 Tax=Rhizobium sp. BK538 TaxID=2586984 RepID=UPI0016213D46|nr:GGDEF domain-containing protein [Rhizobium sp. BK538]MBB4172095.1 diguanylate cyclase (GGDEF)-like protein [Rhizobium sp. BK538]